MQVAKTPQVTTPLVLQQAMPPWVTQTPETSPMMWGRVPTNGPFVSAEKGISKEYLRVICEPFFEQMLVAVQQALQVQSQQFHPGCYQAPMPFAGRVSEEPSTEDGSDIYSDGGAFSTIFTSHSGIIADEVDSPAKAQQSQDVQCSAGIEAKCPKPESAQTQAMVCRHWKSKGWCRMEDKCKFLHPEHKRGNGVVAGKPGSVNGDGNMDTAVSVLPGTAPEQFPEIAKDDNKKSGSKRRNKGKSGKIGDSPAAKSGSTQIPAE